ncbi:aminotransferase class IV family protein [Streptomyces sp. DSM 3412]|uniref:Aminotransferase class IV family protein n=1 Tax=Streptomyces gottesmaniae TaxID=3075518 RepID=A0ABU2Z0L3_9ACTN|nr:aminotransferase class IV family protein [Streptomyces sp. DSM 3412]MDT0570110.1 aminotransferase class IV family protein [Streptomyces sp. DSM 3412]
MAELNGNPVTLEDLQSLALTNYGHFTSMRMEDGTVRGLSLHLDRLVRDCRIVFGVELDREQTLAYIRKAAKGVTGVAGLRVTVFDPALDMGRPSDAKDPHILVNLRPAGAMPPPPLTAKTFNFTRDNAEVKHIGLHPQLRLRRDAQLAGFDDAVFIEPDGRVSEGGTWNLGFVDQNGTVIWPDAPVLPGTTMLLLRGLDAPKQITAPVRLADIPNMAAAFATNVTIGVRSVSAIDDVHFPQDHPVLAALRDAYAGIPGERL